MNRMKPTYKMETSPEPAMNWKDYEELILAEWNELLNKIPSPTESAVQHFLEQYPSMVPGAFNLIGAESGHHPWLRGLFSQPVLPSFDHHKPDFMWLSQNSDTVEPVLIEIEAPGKLWWTKSGQPTATLTQALDQIAEWKAWFREPHNVQEFKDIYELTRVEWRKRHFRPSYLLIYGRRSEANGKPNLTAKRSLQAQDDVKIITFDRLNPNPKADQLVCLKVINDRGQYVFKAISVPATLIWKPPFACDRARLSGLDSAIESNKHISQKRKEFLIRRLQYWNEWSKKQNHDMIYYTSGDEE